jgi:putative hydrolase of the HAD superfamily
MLPYDIVFFDAGRTLLYTRDPVGVTYSTAAARHGIDVAPDAMEASFHAAFRARRARDSGAQDRAWWWEVVKLTLTGVGVPGEHEALFDELHGYYERPEAWRLYPDARETLAAVRERGYRTGLISNWDERLPDLLVGMGLADGLDPIVVSCEVGWEKPDPRIFRHALDLAGVAPERCLMVGDDPVADIEGATALGMHAVRIDHGAADAANGTITTLAQLLRSL